MPRRTVTAEATAGPHGWRNALHRGASKGKNLSDPCTRAKSNVGASIAGSWVRRDPAPSARAAEAAIGRPTKPFPSPTPA